MPFQKGHKFGKRFIKGHSPWNKDKKGIHISPKSEFQKGHKPWNTGIKGISNTGTFKKGHKTFIGNLKHGQSKTKEYACIYQNRRRKQEICENKLTLKEWKEIKKSYNFTCPSCFQSEPKIKLTIDHIRPLSLGGLNNKENIQPLCKSCNCKKHKKEIKYEKTMVL